jgi:polysaccharide export outer membrane protein
MLTISSPAQAVDPDVYRMGPGDILEVVVWKEDRLSRNDILVRPDGRISLPMVDDIIAAGLTPMELKEAITKSAGRFVQRPMVYVIVREPRSHSYSVIGNVRSPGRFPLEQPTTVLQGIAEAWDGDREIKMIMMNHHLNKKEQAVTLLSNFIKTAHDVESAIINSMR